jgi:hypothetical protein
MKIGEFDGKNNYIHIDPQAHATDFLTKGTLKFRHRPNLAQIFERRQANCHYQQNRIRPGKIRNPQHYHSVNAKPR